jgi:hypothetical protein
LTGPPSGWESGLSGRHITLKPVPFQLPGNNASGPRCSAVVMGPCPYLGGTG